MKDPQQSAVRKPEAILSGWKQIAEFLGVTAWTAQRQYTKSTKTSNPMPILKNEGIKAIPEDLRDWLRSRK